MGRIPTTPAAADDNARAGKERQGSTRSAHTPIAATAVVEAHPELEIAPHDRHVYRMSSLGGDTAMLTAAAMGYQPAPMPAKLQPFLQEGTDAEAAILRLFHDQFAMRGVTYPELVALKERDVIVGYDIRTQQPELWLECGTGALLVGHCDELVVVNPNAKTPELYETAGVEAKAFGGSNWREWTKNHDIMAWPRYAWQLSAMMHATGLPFYFVVGEKDRAEIDAGSKGAIVKVDVKLFTEPPFPLAKVKGRVLKAEARVKSGEVPECDEAHWPCPFWDQAFCLGKAPADDVPWDDVHDVDLGKLLSLYYAYSLDMQDTDEQKDAKKKRDAVKEQIDKLVADKGYTRGKKMHVWTDTGEELEFEWVQRPVKAREYTQSYPVVKIVTEKGTMTVEDHA